MTEQREHSSTDHGAQGWPPAVRYALLGAATLAVLLFLSGFFFSVPLAFGLLIVSILGRRQLGGIWVWTASLSVLAIVLSIVWMLVSLDAGSAISVDPMPVSTPRP
ncbi:hypothetical protein [Agromyces sp. NPDC055658]